MAPDTLHGVDARVDPQGVVLLVPEEEFVPEDSEHERLVDLVYAGLAQRFADHEDVAVHCRLAWFPDRDNTRIRLDPDVMVVFGRPQEHRKSYRAWAEDNVAPAVFVEVVSEDDTDRRYRERLERARSYGVAQIVLISPFTAGGVRVEHLVADGSVPSGWRVTATTTNATAPITVETLGVTFAGGTDLLVSDDSGVWQDTPTLHRRAREADADARRADAQARRAEAEARRADAQARRAEAEARRADRLAAALREAGIDPETV